MPSLLPTTKLCFLGNNGLPLVGGKLYTYDSGTNTPRATYADAAGGVPNTNPVVLDARGEALVFWSGSYRVKLCDAAGNVIWTVDSVSEIVLSYRTSGTGSIIVPYGTTAQRDTTPVIGYMRYNTDIGEWEGFGENGWGVLGANSTQKQLWSAFPTTGAAPTYVITAAPAVTLTANTRLRAKFHAANVPGVATTLNANGLGSIGIKQYNSAGNKVNPTITAGQLSDIEYDGADWVLYDRLPDSVVEDTRTVTGSTTLTAADYGKAIFAVSATPITLTVPAAIDKKVFTIYNQGPAAVLVNGGTFYALEAIGVASFQLYKGESIGLICAGTSFAQVWGNRAPYGIDQLLVDMTGSRSFTVSYTNGGNKPRDVYINMTGSGAGAYAQAAIVSGGVNRYVFSSAAAGAAGAAVLSFTVNPGESYSVANAYLTCSVQSWVERVS